MRILYIFPNPRSTELALSARQEIPRNRFYGMLKFIQMGHEVSFSDERFSTLTYKMFGRFMRSRDLNKFDIKSLIRMKKYDLVIIKDTASPSPAIACSTARIPCVFIDCFRQHFWWHTPYFQSSIKFASGAFVYSQCQALQWSRLLCVPASKIRAIRFGIDTQFFNPVSITEIFKDDYILSVCADDRRDLQTLDKAVNRTKMRVKLISNKTEIANYNWLSKKCIEVHYSITYEKLLNLYSKARFVVIPIRPNTHYPSGLTALLEAIAMKKPIVCARTKILEEYFDKCKSLLFYSAGNASSLASALTLMKKRLTYFEEKTTEARKNIEELFSVERMEDEIYRCVMESIVSYKQ